MKFTKYETKKAYHWREYVRGGKYKKHVDRIKKWVKEANLLDVGAGDGVVTYKLRAKGIDNEHMAVHLAQTMGVDVTYGSAYSLPFPDDSFDAVLMIDVIEHLDEPKLAIAEAKRVAPVIYIATPERQPDKAVRDQFHVQEWTIKEFVDFMKECGLKLTGDVLKVDEGDTFYARFERIISNA